MKVYLSSTYRDLREHRLAVDRALRRMGHDIIGMEQYVAEGAKPVDRCLADVAAADAYLLILGWRYGYCPPPNSSSITELEFLEAKKCGKPVLAFLLNPEAPWPIAEIDAMTTDADAAANIRRFRDVVGRDFLAGIFTTPEDLASQVATAVARQSLGQKMVERLLDQDAVNSKDMIAFGQGTELSISSIPAITDMVRKSGHVGALVIDLGDGDEWWSTRLYLLASLLRDLTQIRQLVFRTPLGFGGMASPAAVLDGLGAVFPELDDFRRSLSDTKMTQGIAGLPLPSSDTDREVMRQTQIWSQLFANATSTRLPEKDVKVGVRSELLKRWLGERLVDRCIQIDEAGPTMVQVQQIIDSLLPDLPLERRVRTSAGGVEILLQVISRNAFALALAREWVRSSLPRTPIL